jgi:uncharacterized protein YegP (UPF0339 family)
MAAKAKVEKIVVYKDDSGDWRWSAKAKNGKTVADSAEGYRNKSYAIKMARSLHPSAKLELWS